MTAGAEPPHHPFMNTTTAPAQPSLSFVSDLTRGQVVKVGSFTGTVISAGKAPRSPKWSVLIDVGGQKMDFRAAPDDPMTVLPADAAPTVRAEDHRPDFDNANTGTSCSCGFTPAKRPSRSSMWNAAYNRHVRSLGLLGI